MTDKIVFHTNGEEHTLPVDSSRTLRVGSKAPFKALKVDQHPMGSDMNERARITFDGAMFVRDGEGQVYQIVDNDE